MDKPKLVAVVGTNASGKSALGIELARRFHGEILSADSRQVFRGFDLCCGKVTAAERALAPHHLLDLREVGEPFSVSDFQAACYALIPEIEERGRVPFLVGGTGLYVASVVHGYDLAQGWPDEALRAELEEKTLEELRALLCAPERERLQGNPSDWSNKRRLIRSVERGLAAPAANAPRYDTLQLGLTWSPEALAARIHSRLEERLRAGMLDEVRDYLAAGGAPEPLEALGLEYRHILHYLTGRTPTEADFRDGLERDIRRFAKRQMTWFRRDGSIRWLDAAGDYREEAAQAVAAFLGV